MANLSRLVVTIFSNLAFISSSIYMAKLSRLIAASFSSLVHLFFFCLHGQPEVFVSDNLLQSKFSLQLIFITSLQFLRVTRRCFSWSSVSDDLFFSSCNFLVILLVLLFRVLSSAFLYSVLQSLKLCLL